MHLTSQIRILIELPVYQLDIGSLYCYEKECMLPTIGRYLPCYELTFASAGKRTRFPEKKL